MLRSQHWPRGGAIARALHGAGATVALSGTRVEALEGLASELGENAHITPANLSDAESLAALIGTAEEAMGAVDILINNAGLFLDNPFVGDPGPDWLSVVESAHWLTAFRVNTVAPFMMTRALRVNLKAADHGTVVMISAMMGSLTNNQSGGAYCYRSSKAALNAVTVSLATDLAVDGTRVVALHPGWLQTDMGGDDAPVDAPTSAKGLRTVMLNIDAKQNGGFFDYAGASIPW